MLLPLLLRVCLPLRRVHVEQHGACVPLQGRGVDGDDAAPRHLPAAPAFEPQIFILVR
jgi:hypothetical protein